MKCLVRGRGVFIMNWALSQVIFLNRSISQIYFTVLAPDFLVNRLFLWNKQKVSPNLAYWSNYKTQNAQFIIKAPRSLFTLQKSYQIGYLLHSKNCSKSYFVKKIFSYKQKTRGNTLKRKQQFSRNHYKYICWYWKWFSTCKETFWWIILQYLATQVLLLHYRK